MISALYAKYPEILTYMVSFVNEKLSVISWDSLGHFEKCHLIIENITFLITKEALVSYAPSFVVSSVSIDCTTPLTHWGRVTHTCVCKLTTIGSDNGLSPGRRQAIIWSNAGILLIGSLGTNLCNRNSGIFWEMVVFFSRPQSARPFAGSLMTKHSLKYMRGIRWWVAHVYTQHGCNANTNCVMRFFF